MQESGLTEITPLMCTPALWGQCPVFPHPESPQGAPLGVTTVAHELMAGILNSLRAHQVGGVVGNGCNILCLLIWQAAFLVHTHLGVKSQTEVNDCQLPLVEELSWSNPGA